MITVHTQSGSVYLIDTANKQICSVIGITTATQRATDKWKSYHDLSPNPLTVGEPMLIVWPPTEPLLRGAALQLQPDTKADPGEVVLRTTITSLVVKIQEEEPS
jgi:hypothetical protein